MSRQYVRSPDGPLEPARLKTEDSVRLVSVSQAAATVGSFGIGHIGQKEKAHRIGSFSDPARLLLPCEPSVCGSYEKGRHSGMNVPCP